MNVIILISVHKDRYYELGPCNSMVQLIPRLYGLEVDGYRACSISPGLATTFDLFLAGS